MLFDSTFQPPLTPSTVKSSSRLYKGDSVCRGRPSIGWLTTLVVDVRSSEQMAVIQKTLLSTLAFHKDQSLAQRHFLNTLKTSHISWMACIITCLLMTCRAKSTEGQLMSQQSSQLQKTVLRTSAHGAQRNVFSSMPRRSKFCGSARQQTCARFRQTTAASALVPQSLVYYDDDFVPEKMQFSTWLFQTNQMWCLT